MPHSRLASPSATIAVLERYGLRTRKVLGQHFLVDDNIVGRILGLARIEPGSPVLEVGPGIGTLTDALLSASAHVVAVEYDDRLLPALANLTAAEGSLTLVHADAVVVPVADLVTPAGPPRIMVANLPYAVAATVVLRFFEELPSLDSAVVMVQSEVADRMTASPGTKAYGAYTVKLGLHASVGGRFAVPRSCFLPPPRVDSAVIRLDRLDRTILEETLAAACRVADAAFSQRRKTLRNSLAAGLGIAVGEVEAMLSGSGIDPGLRAEQLTLEQYEFLGFDLRNLVSERCNP
ncbi:MAG: 16S rRNA (adenine(1518)-N(6)/adenine(1519)-N(6))-dimethyltransferase RsmA [Actinobacteria bacterium]|nr:16S rRNA (adenine(1518)-N(6)/adenine(1519)-N(6))-dimethyltransferase RsmA [Actinomycetota bacterium]